ncbi:RDD family protein [Paeniglutamicibacter cryotolerans]|uniref:Putative RDD family membrane protein YckC n=1 Tax=Paeniglutamicibacter cryotolerans TaxID=670079 RepID=A0A839QPX4_9MICC|nr:RDD family protein [Paeniglutamicibacter cryotolerans]MBB2996036.1 putative RDD family membrane protein YckC [Paeniglutamicibacter cryotolerans]
MAQAQNLVNAPAGRRLGAALLDAVPYLIAYGVLLAMIPGTLGKAAPGQAVSAVALVGPSLFMLAYSVFLWGWEARAGKTPGNVLLGIRTTNEDGFAPGWGRVLLRRLVIAVANIVPVAGPVVVLLSNLWDANSQRQGWHDKVAKTLVLDVRAGRNPITTGGLFGPSAFAPQQPADLSAPAGYRQPAAAQFTGQFDDQQFDAHGYPGSAGADATGVAQQQPGPITAVPGAAAAGAGSPAQLPPPPPTDRDPAPADADRSFPVASNDSSASASAVPDHEAEDTRLHAAVPEPEAALLAFDDGQSTVLLQTVLIGRNPAPASGEGPVALFNVADLGRSVSKTHLALTLHDDRVWVTDRNSTNGSGITGADGAFRPLEPGEPVPARFGDTVHFGDRSFEVRRP